jgi:hypothetical protein
METKLLIKNRLNAAGIPVNEEVLDQLVPMYRQWQHYIDEARRMDISGEEEPAHKFVFDI